MAKAKKKSAKTRSTASKVMKAVASLIPHKKATKKAKSNPKSQSAKVESAAKSKSRGVKAATSSMKKAAKASIKKASKTSLVTKAKKVLKPKVNLKSKSKSKSAKTAATSGYADTLKSMVAQKKDTMKTGHDPAHAPGHRKLKIAGLEKTGAKNSPMDASVLNNNSKSDRIQQTESAQRRLGRR